MKIWGVYDDEIREIVEEVGLGVFNNHIKRVGRAYQFRLGLGPKTEDGTYRFQKLSVRGRGTGFVCWHGHREFLFALFRRFPDARVKSGLEDYRSRDDFRENYRRTWGEGNDFNISEEWRCGCPQQGENPNRRRRRRPRSLTVQDLTIPAERRENLRRAFQATTRAFQATTPPLILYTSEETDVTWAGEISIDFSAPSDIQSSEQES